MFISKFLLDFFIDFMLIGSVADFTFIYLVLKLLNVLTVIIILLNLIITIFFNLLFKAVNLMIANLLVGGLTLFFI